MFSYSDMYKERFKDDPNVIVEELSDSFKIPGWEQADNREEMSRRMNEIEQKRNIGLSLVKKMDLRMPSAVRGIKR